MKAKDNHICLEPKEDVTCIFFRDNGEGEKEETTLKKGSFCEFDLLFRFKIKNNLFPIIMAEDDYGKYLIRFEDIFNNLPHEERGKVFDLEERELEFCKSIPRE